MKKFNTPLHILAVVAPSVAVLLIGIGALQIDDARKSAENHAFALEQKLHQQNVMARDEVARLDKSIVAHYDTIEQIENAKEKCISDSLNNNRNYTERKRIRHDIDSMYIDNQFHIKRAHKAAIVNHPYLDATRIPCTKRVLYMFFHDDTVKREYRKYHENVRKISDMKERLQKIPQANNLSKDVRIYFENLTNAQIYNQLNTIEMLLRKKDSLITQKIK